MTARRRCLAGGGAQPSVDATASMPPSSTRRVDRKGLISFATTKYRAGVWLAGQDVTVVCDGGLVQLHHRGVLIATHARRHALDKQTAATQRAPHRRPQQPTASAVSVARKVTRRAT